MNDFATQLSGRVAHEFAAAGIETELAVVRRSDRPDLGDFQCNGALPAAKKRGENPRALADNIKAKLEGDALFNVSIAGPGFINFTLSDAMVAARANELAADPRVGALPATKPARVFVDFAGPNVAKPMHVGHLRATIIGDSLQRIARFLGHQVTSDAHFGDWGLQIGLLITALQDEQPDLPYFRADYDESMFLAEPPVTMADLDRMYPAASARMKQEPAYLDRARKATAELQKGRPGYLALHRHFWKVSQVALNREFQSLDIHFDLWKGESDVNYLIDEVVEHCKDKGIAVPSEGAVVIHVTRDSDKKTVPPLILVSSEGSAMYGTTDLATLLERFRDVAPDTLLYVVDQRQALHFTQVFRAAVLAGYCREEQLEHIGFGTMNGTDGKPFRTRAGDVVKLHDLITTCREKAMEKMLAAGFAAELNDAEKADTALAIGTAALKFADLSNVRTTNYVFDVERFTSFEGKTGPYIQQQGVRIKSVLAKAAERGLSAGPVVITGAAERALVLALDPFDAAVQAAFAQRMPHFLAEHVFALAQQFASFYAAAPILPEENAEVRSSRLRLAETTLRQLELGAGLLGIKIPQRM
jgi:arginyl-tRNA synthetase